MPPRNKGKSRAADSDEEVEEEDDVEAQEEVEVEKKKRPKQTLDKQSLKAAIWYTVAQIVQEEELDLGLSASEQFVASLTELVYSQAETLALDLKDFASHAQRTTIRPEDVKLMGRKMSGLQQLLSEELEKHNASGSTTTTMKPKAGQSVNPPVPKPPRPRPKPAAAVANAASGSKPPGMPGMLRKGPKK